MTRVTPLPIFLFLLCTPLLASAAAQEKGKTANTTEQSWKVEFDVSPDRYTGTMTLTVEDNVVSGTMLIDWPTRIDGKVEGTKTGDAYLLDYPFTVQEQNCSGRVKVDVKLTPEGDAASGTADVVDCDGQQIKGTVSMKKVVTAQD